jgi:serine/threonine-protein kinase HipA
MKVGGEYRLLLIDLRHWQKLAREVRIDADELIERLNAMASQLPDEINDARKPAGGEGLDQAIVDRLAARLTKRAAACLRLLTAA